VQNLDLQFDEGKVEDGSMYCKFRLKDPLKFARHFENNTDETFYLVGVAGSLEGQYLMNFRNSDVTTN